MSKPLAISPDDLLRVLEKMGYCYYERTIDMIYLVSEKAGKIAIPVKEVIGEKKLEKICETLKVPLGLFFEFFSK